MNKCPSELLERILDYACIGDGQTARRAGLVSKSFRSIAAPLELRSITVSGLKQMKRIIARLEKENLRTEDGDHKSRTEVRYLFVSELPEEDAVTEEKCAVPAPDVWRSTLNRDFARGCRHDAPEFWKLATVLVRETSSTIRSLSLLAADPWFDETYVMWTAKVLGTISGVSFPRLVSVTILHNTLCDEMSLENIFEHPAAPRLRHLRVLSPLYLEGGGRLAPATHYHPLLLLDDIPESVESVIPVRLINRIIFQAEWTASSSATGTDFVFPVKPRSVAVLPSPVNRDLHQATVDGLRRLNVSGLYAHEKYPEGEKTWYEALLESWKEECRKICLDSEATTSGKGALQQ